MKTRITGLVLGILLTLSVVIPVYAVKASGNGAAAVVLDQQPSFVEETAEKLSDCPVYLDAEQMTELEYQVINGTIYATVESFVQALGEDAVFDEEDDVLTVECLSVNTVDHPEYNTSSAVEEALCLTAKVGKIYVAANDRNLYVKDQVQRVNGKVALPVSILAKIFNLSNHYVTYDNEVCQILLNRSEDGNKYILSGDQFYNEDDLYWMSHIISAESGDQPMTGRIAVGNVVLNRVRSGRFPNTIVSVLFQKNQFSPAMSGSIYREPDANSIVAAKMVLDGAVVFEDALFFNMAGLNCYASRNRPYVATIGDHNFYN